MDLDSAIQKHAEWKMKFRSAIAKQESLDVATIAKDNCCDLGKWLHGEGKSQYGSLGSHADCLVQHAKFHVEAGRVAQAINAKKYADAENMMGSGTPYSTASNVVASAIMKLKKEARL